MNNNIPVDRDVQHTAQLVQTLFLLTFGHQLKSKSLISESEKISESSWSWSLTKPYPCSWPELWKPHDTFTTIKV